MTDNGSPNGFLRFADFEADRAAQELRKGGAKVRLEVQPFQVLLMLLERQGEVVTREELKQALWADDTFVDFDSGVNQAVSKIRRVLGDSAARPRFVETLPRRGYRFVGRVDPPEPAAASQTGLTPSIATGVISPGPLGRKQAVLVTVAALGALLAVVFGFLWLSSQDTVAETPLRRFAVSPTPGVRDSRFSRTAAVAPNGQHIAFAGAGPSRKLWVQDLESGQQRAIEGTEGAILPFWSPTSDFIGFAVGAELKKVSVQGGLAIRLCELPGNLLGATWSPDGNSIVFSSPDPFALYEVPARGGAANLLISPEEPSSGGPWGVVVRPHFLPLDAGARVLVFAFGSPTNNTMMVQDLETDRREILGPGNFPAYSSSGHLLYQPSFVTHEIWALPFSLDTLQATGKAFPIAENGRGPTVASDGTLVYLDHIPLMSQLDFVDRAGAAKEQIGQPMADVRNLALSPDGRRVAFSVVQDSKQDIWIHDLVRNLRNRLTTAPERDWVPVWSAKGDEVAFSSRSNRGISTDISRRRVDGTGEREMLVGTPVSEVAGDWSADGKYLIYRRMDPQTRADLWYLLREGEDWTPHTFLQTSADERQPRFSPDSRYVAYVSDQSGRREVYVRAFPEGEKVSRISRNGGTAPRWNPNGRELFYVEGSSLIAVPVSMSPSFSPGEPTRLFDATGLSEGDNSPGYDVSPDGQQFIIAQPVGDPPRPSIRVVQNWYEEFREREQD